MKAKETTRSLKEKDIVRNWHKVDVKGKVLGRVVPEIAKLLQGKNKKDYAPYLDCGDYVVVVNASQVVVTGRKANTITYRRYSGYPGGLKEEKFADLISSNPKKIVEAAVSGMLPKNKFRTDRLRRMFVFKDENHNYNDKFTK